jgi:HK97 family phage major capsid protein
MSFPPEDVAQLNQMSALELGDYRREISAWVDEVRSALRKGEATKDELIDARDHLRELDSIRDKAIGEAVRNPRAVERESTYTPPGRDSGEEVRSIRGEIRDDALRTIDSYRSKDVLSAEAADRLDDVVRHQDHAGMEGRYLSAVGSREYMSAFGKLIAHPLDAHVRMTPRELESVQRVQGVMQERAMVEGSGGTGKYGVPVEVDPTILLSSSGALNPIRQLARVFTVSTNKWTGVSGSVTASFADELTEVGDGTPTLAQPVVNLQKAHVFVPFSIELSQDYANLTQELAKTIADAKDVLEAQVFLDGLAASFQPVGIVSTAGALTTASRVQTATTATTAIADIYSLKQALPARWLANGVFVMNPNVKDVFRRFVGGGNTAEPFIVESQAEGATVLSRECRDWTNMVTTTTTSGSKIALFADFKATYAIADRIGLEVELVPHIFGASNRFPIGARGLYAYWRTGGGILVGAAARYLEVR